MTARGKYSINAMCLGTHHGQLMLPFASAADSVCCMSSGIKIRDMLDIVAVLS